MKKPKKYSRKYYGGMRERDLVKFGEFMLKMVWRLWIWLGVAIAAVVVFLWETATDLLENGNEKLWWFVMSLLIAFLCTITLGGYFIATNWQIIAKEGIQGAFCVRFPRGCLKREIKQEMRENPPQSLQPQNG